jgi:asparagine N-glycosylation enzyme membrane subunit Stt3
MHFNSGFTAVQVLWTLTFAALLVLLVVLLGRDRARRFPWFTASIVLVALRLLASRLLFGRMPQLTLSTVFIVFGDLAAIVGMLLVVELARRAFGNVTRRTWVVWTLVAVAVAAGVLAVWGPWPSWKTLTAESALALLRVMQLAAQKGDLLVEVLTVELSLLVILFGRRFKAGWRSHTQQILIGLSTAAIGQMAIQGVWQLIAQKAAPQSRAEYERLIGMRDNLFNANGALYLAVVLWWIVCLWINEPGAGAVAEASMDALPAEAGVDAGESSTVDEPPQSI